MLGLKEGRKLENPEKPSEWGENREQTQSTNVTWVRIKPRTHWWELSALTAASSLLPGLHMDKARKPSTESLTVTSTQMDICQ